jgi:hypothetical protein
MPILSLSDTNAAYDAGRVHVQRFYKGANSTIKDGFWQDWSFAAGQPAYDARIGVSGAFNPYIASKNDAIYFPGIVVLRSGTGAGQAARINSYAGSTRIATVATPWTVQPDATTIFTVETWASVRVTDIESTPATDIASAVIAAATTTPIAANIKKVNDIAVNGVGTSGNPWGP